MERFIVNKESISVEEIRQDLIDHIQAQPDFLRFKDFYESSAGKILINWIAGYAAYFIYHVVVGRREAYLTYAQNRSSNLAIAQNLSYSAFRGRNAVVSVLVEPTSSPVSLQKYQVIGNVQDQDLIVLDDAIINTGDSVRVNCVVGVLREEELLVDSDIKKPFRFRSSLVSDDIRLYQNGSELNFEEELKQLIQNDHVLISNPFGAVDLYYLNNVAPFYDAGDTFKIEFVRLQEISFDVSEIEIFDAEISSPELVSPFRQPEPIDELKINAPLYFETQFQIRGRNDFSKIFKFLDASIIDTGGTDAGPSVVELTYIRDDLTNFNQSERDSFVSQLEQDLPYGSITSKIRNPERGDSQLDINIVLSRSTNENIPAITRGIIQAYEKKLEVEVDKEQIESDISSLPYVKSCRVNDRLKLWEEDTYFSPVEFSVENFDCGEPKFQFFRHVRKSGNSEPTWPTNDGDQIWDNEILWEASDERTCNLDDWSSESNYFQGDKIKPENGPSDLVFICVATRNITGTSVPSFNTDLGDITKDANIKWQRVDIAGSYPAWQPEANYFIGDTIEYDGNLYQVVGFRSKTGGSQPVFPTVENIIFEDGQVQWISRNREARLFRMKWYEYCLIDEDISIV